MNASRRLRVSRRIAALVIGLSALLIVATAGTAGVIATSQGTCNFVSNSTALQCMLGTLLPGQSATIRFGVPAPAPGTLVNTVTVGSHQVELFPTNNRASAHVRIREAADIALVKYDSPDPVRVGNPLTYTIVMVNNGPSPAPNVTIVDQLPPTVSLVSVNTSYGACFPAGQSIGCSFGLLPVGSQVVIKIVVIPHEVGTITNVVSVACSIFDPVPGNNRAEATTRVDPAVVDLQVTKTGSPSVVNVGDMVNYTITVTNAGPDVATGVVLNDQMLLVGN